jgi:hypothetical protein
LRVVRPEATLCAVERVAEIDAPGLAPRMLVTMLPASRT